MHDAPPRAQLPVKVTISPRGLGRGPSAGLAFTLEVYDALTGHKLAKGRRIAVTGTIDLDGNVGEIGGVHQKVIGAARKGADLVLVPPATPPMRAPLPTGASRSCRSARSARRSPRSARKPL